VRRCAPRQSNRRVQSRKSGAVRRERKAKAQLERGRSQACRRGNGEALTSQEAAQLEALIYPERAPLARVVLASGSFGYDPRDDDEVVRIARLIADEPEVASLDHDDLRTRLASVRNGSTSTFQRLPSHAPHRTGAMAQGFSGHPRLPSCVASGSAVQSRGEPPSPASAREPLALGRPLSRLAAADRPRVWLGYRHVVKRIVARPGRVAFCGKYDTGIIRAVNISRRRGRGITLTPPRDDAENAAAPAGIPKRAHRCRRDVSDGWRQRAAELRKLRRETRDEKSTLPLRMSTSPWNGCGRLGV
jgi:hypothetical protein